MIAKLIVLAAFTMLLAGCTVGELNKKLIVLNDIQPEETAKTASRRQPDIISTTGETPFIKDVNCEPSGLLEFWLANPQDATFSLKQLPQFEAEALGHLATRLTLNGRQFALPAICDKETLKKGDEASCRITFDPTNRREKYQIRTRTDILMPAPKNFLRFITPGYGYEVIFTCD